MSLEVNHETTAVLQNLVGTISRTLEQEGPGGIDVRAAKRRNTIAPANAFCICFHASMAKIMDKAKLSRPALRLLFELIDISAAGNLISVNQKGLAARIGVSPNSVSRSMKRLISAGVVLELEHGLFLNPQLISKQALARMAELYPAEVIAGIEALQAQGFEKNWNPDLAKKC